MPSTNWTQEIRLEHLSIGTIGLTPVSTRGRILYDIFFFIFLAYEYTDATNKIKWIAFKGFSTSQRTWLPVNSNHWYLNLAFQKVCLRSHYQTYKTLLKLRLSPTIAQGNLIIHTPSDWILILTRYSVAVIIFYGHEQNRFNFKCFKQNSSHL